MIRPDYALPSVWVSPRSQGDLTTAGAGSRLRRRRLGRRPMLKGKYGGGPAAATIETAAAQPHVRPRRHDMREYIVFFALVPLVAYFLARVVLLAWALYRTEKA